MGGESRLHRLPACVAVTEGADEDAAWNGAAWAAEFGRSFGVVVVPVWPVEEQAVGVRSVLDMAQGRLAGASDRHRSRGEGPGCCGNKGGE